MSQPTISLALEHYDRATPILDGTVRPTGIDLRPIAVGQSPGSRHERMLKHMEFDACELSLSSYLMAKARGAPITAIPVFPRRLFSQSQMYVNTQAGIRTPMDLVGKKVGLNMYQVTLPVLAKGDLQYEYGLPFKDMTWVTAREETVAFQTPEGVRIERVPTGREIDDMLAEGEIQAFFVPRPPQPFLDGDPRVSRLFPNPREEEKRYFENTGFYPIMHLIALKDQVYQENPWIARNLMEMFEEAKEACYRFYDDPNWSQLAWARLLLEEERVVLGSDPWPNGLSRNRSNLDRFIQYSYDQGLIPRKLAVEEMFAASTHET